MTDENRDRLRAVDAALDQSIRALHVIYEQLNIASGACPRPHPNRLTIRAQRIVEAYRAAQALGDALGTVKVLHSSDGADD